MIINKIQTKEIDKKLFTSVSISNNLPNFESKDVKDYHFIVEGFYDVDSENTIVEFFTREPQTINTAFLSDWEDYYIQKD